MPSATADPVDVAVHDQVGAAVADARLLLLADAESTGAPGNLLHRPTVAHWIEVGASDAEGNARLSLPLPHHPLDPGRTSLLVALRAFGRTHAFVFNGSEYGYEVLDADRGTSSVTLLLEAMPTMRIRAVDTSGQPVEGAMMSLLSGKTSSSSDSDVEKHIRRLAAQVNHQLRDRHRADAEGHIVLPFVPPPPGTFVLEAWSDKVGLSKAIPLRATTEEVELVLRKD